MLEDEDKLIRGAKQGKNECFDKLYSHYLPPIYRFIYMKVSRREEAEDLTHEVFLNAWQNVKGYKLQGFPFSSWLYQIARNRVIDYYRLQKNHVPIEMVDADAEPVKFQSSIETELDLGISLEKVRFAMQGLSQDQQDVLLMRFMEDLSHEEIALAMKKSEGAVRLIQHRAINELKKLLNNGGTNS